MATQQRNPVAHLTLRHGSWVWSDQKLTLKLLLVGDAAVGKTSLIRRFANNEFVAKYEPTIGADLTVKEVVVDGHDVAVQLWDTAGNSEKETIGSSFYRGAQLVVLVFDLTNRKSFEALQRHYDRILSQSGFADLENFPCMVLGNKRDRPDVCVELGEVEEWCRARRPDAHVPIMYVATSAKDGTNTVEAFEHIVSMALEGVRRAAPETLHPPVSPKTSSASTTSPRKKKRPDGSWIHPNAAKGNKAQTQTEPVVDQEVVPSNSEHAAEKESARDASTNSAGVTPAEHDTAPSTVQQLTTDLLPSNASPTSKHEPHTTTTTPVQDIQHDHPAKQTEQGVHHTEQQTVPTTDEQAGEEALLTEQAEAAARPPSSSDEGTKETFSPLHPQQGTVNQHTASPGSNTAPATIFAASGEPPVTVAGKETTAPAKSNGPDGKSEHVQTYNSDDEGCCGCLRVLWESCFSCCDEEHGDGDEGYALLSD